MSQYLAGVYLCCGGLGYGCTDRDTRAAAHVRERAEGRRGVAAAVLADVGLHHSRVATAADCFEGGGVGLRAVYVVLAPVCAGCSHVRLLLDCCDQACWWCRDYEARREREECEDGGRLGEHCGCLLLCMRLVLYG